MNALSSFGGSPEELVNRSTLVDSGGGRYIGRFQKKTKKRGLSRPLAPDDLSGLKIPSDVKHYNDRRTIKLKVGGRRARRWLYFVAEVLKAEGGYGVMYSDEMGAPSAGFPGERNGLWNGIGEWASIPKDVFVGPLWVGDTGGWSSRMLFMSTRSSGHGIP